MSHELPETVSLNRLRQLAEFRYQLRRFLSFSEAEAERFGVSTQQYQLMQVIEAVPPGETASITYLAERMVLRHNSAVELVDRAERSGLVRRTSDSKDLRRSIVVLTPHGQSILQAMILSHLEQIDGEGGAHLEQAIASLRLTGEAGDEPGAASGMDEVTTERIV